MTDIPYASQFNDPSTTEGQFKREFAILLTALGEMKKITDMVNGGLSAANVTDPTTNQTQDTLNKAFSTAINSMVTASTLANALSKKADVANTLLGYGISDAYSVNDTYSKTQIDTIITSVQTKIQSGEINPNMVVAVSSIDSLNALSKFDGRLVYVAGSGWYRYNLATTSWVASKQSADSIDSGVSGQSLSTLLANLSNTIANKASSATTLAGYGITDSYTQTQADNLLKGKLNSDDAKRTYEPLVTATTKLTFNPSWVDIATVGNTALSASISGLAARTDWTKQNGLAILGSLDALNALTGMVDGQSYYVSGQGVYKYSLATTAWVKQATFNDYDFKTEQPIQYYYDLLGNWDDAIFEAQVNVYLKGYSPVLALPSGQITITKPIFGSKGLYQKFQKERPEVLQHIPDTTKMAGLYLKGVPKYTEGMPFAFLGTQILFTGHTSETDTQWSNFGIIHFATQDPTSFKNTNYDQSIGSGKVVIRDLNIMTDSYKKAIHGIVVQGGSHHIIENVFVYSLYGAGIFLDWIFDSTFNNLAILRTGRMSPKYQTFIADGNYSVDYQTYAPLHITRSTLDSADNSNFLYFSQVHFEDNTTGNADIIVSGDSTPIVIRDVHHETDGLEIGGQSAKSCFALGSYGVKYFGQDQEEGFDYTKFEKSSRGATVTFENVRLYTPGFNAAGYSTFYCASNLINCDYGLPLHASGYNTFGTITLINSIIGDFIHTGYTIGYLLKGVNSTFGDIKLGYDGGSGGSTSLTQCDVSSISIGSNAAGSWADDLTVTLTDSNVGYITGNYPKVFGSVNLTSKDTATDFTARISLNLEINSYVYYENKILGK